MGYSVRVIADSISQAGHRLTTLEVVFPRFILAEFNTHRVLSRNSASSRAIPVIEEIRRLMRDPFIPERFGVNQPGMQAHTFLSGEKHDEAVRIWLRGRDRAVLTAFELILGESIGVDVDWLSPKRFDEALNMLDPKYRQIHLPDIEILNIHKQLANRPLEPYMWQTVVVTATEWSNFYALRANQEAQPEIRRIAELMLDAHSANEPILLEDGQWHLPYVSEEEIASGELTLNEWAKVSSGRCARVSTLTHDGRRDPSADISLFNRLASSGHMSPLEHQATPLTATQLRVGYMISGNFTGWQQFRKQFLHENDFGKFQLAKA